MCVYIFFHEIVDFQKKRTSSLPSPLLLSSLLFSFHCFISTNGKKNLVISQIQEEIGYSIQHMTNLVYGCFICCYYICVCVMQCNTILRHRRCLCVSVPKSILFFSLFFFSFDVFQINQTNKQNQLEQRKKKKEKNSKS